MWPQHHKECIAYYILNDVEEKLPPNERKKKVSCDVVVFISHELAQCKSHSMLTVVVQS